MNLPNWPSMKGYRDIKLGLERVVQLLERLDNPHQKLPPVIHVAGTNGKGSTLSYMEAILNDAGYKVHKYTSPHLVEFNERIVLRGKEISDSYLNRIILECQIVANVKPEIEVTFFEGITVAAFLAFSRIQADVLLLETGMGGRLDATNVVADPLLTIITSISADHTEFLGKNLSEIAFEKAGIIKKNAPVITSNRDESVLAAIYKKAASINNAPVFHLGKHFDVEINQNNVDFIANNEVMQLDFPALPGKHQIENASLAIAALQIQNHFKISSENIKNGLKNAKWRGRIEKITEGKLRKLLPENYDLYIDGSHNPDSARALANWIAQDNKNSAKNTYLICGMLKNKDANGFFQNFAALTNFVITVPLKNYSEGFKTDEIAKYAAQNGIKSISSANFEQAFAYIHKLHNSFSAKKNLAAHHITKFQKLSKIKNFLKKLIKKDSKTPARVIICGSLYLVGDFLKEN